MSLVGSTPTRVSSEFWGVPKIGASPSRSPQPSSKLDGRYPGVNLLFTGNRAYMLYSSQRLHHQAFLSRCLLWG